MFMINWYTDFVLSNSLSVIIQVTNKSDPRDHLNDDRPN